MATTPIKPEHKEHLKVRFINGRYHMSLRIGNRIITLDEGSLPGELVRR